MSYGKVWNSDNSRIGGVVPNRLIDIQIPNDVMQQLYLPLDGKVYISDNGNLSAKLKLDNSEGGRELQLGFRVDGETPTNGWWESNNKKNRYLWPGIRLSNYKGEEQIMEVSNQIMIMRSIVKKNPGIVFWSYNDLKNNPGILEMLSNQYFK